MKKIKIILLCIMIIICFCSIFNFSNIKVSNADPITIKDLTYGDIIEIGKYKYDGVDSVRPIPWRVVGFKEIDSKMCPLVIMDGLLPEKLYTTFGIGASQKNDDINVYGNDRWATSPIRLWLNSNKSGSDMDYRNSYYSAKEEYKNTDEHNKVGPYGGENGFLYSTNFEDYEYNAIKEVEIKSQVNYREYENELSDGGNKMFDNSILAYPTLKIEPFKNFKKRYVDEFDEQYYELTRDKVFLMGLEEFEIALNNKDNVDHPNGFKYALGKMYHTRMIYISPDRSYDLMIVQSNGNSLGTNYPYSRYCIRPCMYLDPDYEVPIERESEEENASYLISQPESSTRTITPASVSTGDVKPNAEDSPVKVKLESNIFNSGNSTITSAGFYVADSVDKLNFSDAYIYVTSTNQEGLYSIDNIDKYNSEGFLFEQDKKYYYKPFVTSIVNGTSYTVTGAKACFYPGRPIIVTSTSDTRGAQSKNKAKIVSEESVIAYLKLISNMGAEVVETGIEYWVNGSNDKKRVSEINTASQFRKYVYLPAEGDTLLYDANGSIKYSFRAYVKYKVGEEIREDYGSTQQFFIGPPIFSYASENYNDLEKRLSSVNISIVMRDIKSLQENFKIKLFYSENESDFDGLTYDTLGEYHVYDCNLEAGTNLSYEVTLTDLKPGVTYYYRTYAKNNVGISDYTSLRSFLIKTSAIDSVKAVGAQSIRVRGNCFCPKGDEVTKGIDLDHVNIEYSTKTDFSNVQRVTLRKEDCVSDGNYYSIDKVITGLSEKTRYYVRLVSYYSPHKEVGYTTNHIAVETYKKLVLTDLTALKAPVPEEFPVTSFENSEYTANVTWYGKDEFELPDFDEDGKFKYDRKYTAKVNLTIKSSYTSNDITQNMYTVSGGTITNSAKSTKLNVDFDMTPFKLITDTIFNDIVKPVKEEVPIINSFTSEQWSGSMKWLVKDEHNNYVDFNGTYFEGEKNYAAQITLNRKDSYRFVDIPQNSITVNESESVINPEGIYNMDTMVIVAVFPRTGDNVAPSAPKNLSLVYDEVNHKMIITWEKPYDGGKEITKYNVYRLNPDKQLVNNGEIINEEIITNDSVTFEINDVTEVGNYKYVITATNDIGTSGDATTNEITISAKPDKVTDFHVMRVKDGEESITSTVRLWWTAPNDNNSPITKYRIYYTADEIIETSLLDAMIDKPGTNIEVSLGTSKNLLAMPMNVYNFTIYAVNANGEGPVSDTITLDEKKVKVIYKNNGGSIEGGITTHYARYGYEYGKIDYPIKDIEYTTLITPTNENAFFIGWFDDNIFTNKITNETKVTNRENHSIYAKWTGNIESISSQKYTGSEIRPSIIIKDGEYTLREGIDYTLAYDNNVVIGTNTAKVKAYGQNGYEGIIIKNFSIVKNSFDFDWSSLITNDITYNKLYDGTDTVMFNNGGVIESSKIVKQNVDGKEINIIVTGKYNNKNADENKKVILTASLSSSDSNKYMIANSTCTKRNESLDLLGNIEKATIHYTVEPQEKKYDGKNEIDVKITYVSGYIIDDIISLPEKIKGYTNDSNGGNNKDIILLEEIELIGEDKNNYLCVNDSINTKVNIIPADLSDAIITGVENKIFTGSEIEQNNICVKMGLRTLIKDVDYELQYINNVNVGEGKVIIVAKDTSTNYTGNIEKSFNIEKNNLIGIELNDALDWVYTGFAQYVTGQSTGMSGIPLNYKYYGSNSDGTINISKIINDPNTIIDSGIYYVTASLDNNLYTAEPKTAKFVIKPKEIKIDGLKVKDKEYDGKNTAIIDMTNSKFVLVTEGATEEITNKLKEEIDEETGYIELVTDGVIWSYINYNAGGLISPREVTRNGNYSIKIKESVPLSDINKVNNFVLKQDNLSNLKGVITPIELNYSVMVKDKSYDGNTNAEVIFNILNPEKIVIGLDGLKENVKITGISKFKTANIGNNKEVEISDIKTNNTNYVVDSDTRIATANIAGVTGLLPPEAKLTADSKSIKLDRYYKGIKVELISKNEGAESWYALNDSEIYVKYNMPIEINKNTKIKAKSKKEGYLDSEVKEYEYLVRTCDDVLIDIDYIPKNNWQKIKNILENNIDDRALLEEKYSDILSENLYKDGKFTQDEIDNILLEAKQELDKIEVKEKNKDFPNVLRIILERRKIKEIFEKIDEIIVDIDDKLEQLEDLIISLELKTKELKLSLTEEEKLKYKGYLQKYNECLSLRKYKNICKNIDDVAHEEEITLIGLLTKVNKSEGEKVLELKAVKDDLTNVPEVLTNNLPPNTSIVLGYDITAIEKDTPIDISGSEIDVKSGKAVLIKLKIPDSVIGHLENEKIKIYHVKDDETIDEGIICTNQQIEFYKDCSQVIFLTESFSPFYLAVTDNYYVDVTINSGSNGIVSAASCQRIEKGDNFNVRIIPNEGYKSKITINGINVEVKNNELEIKNVIEDLIINVTFEKVNIENPTGGSSESGGSGGGSSRKDDKKNEEKDNKEKNQDINDEKNEEQPVDKGYGTSNKKHNVYIYGYKDKTFRPNSYITRSEVAAILSRIDNRFDTHNSYAEYLNMYMDVDKNYWAAKNIGFTTKINSMIGYEDYIFKPLNFITRGEMASVIARYKEYDYKNKESQFEDTKGRWFEKYVAALEENNVIVGRTDGKFDPDSYVTRAEACTIFNSILDRKPNTEKIKSLGNAINNYIDVEIFRWYYADVIEASNEHIIDKYHN